MLFRTFDSLLPHYYITIILHFAEGDINFIAQGKKQLYNAHAECNIFFLDAINIILLETKCNMPIMCTLITKSTELIKN